MELSPDRYICLSHGKVLRREQGNDDDGILSSEKEEHRGWGARGGCRGGEEKFHPAPSIIGVSDRCQPGLLFARSPPPSPSVMGKYVRETVICTKGAS